MTTKKHSNPINITPFIDVLLVLLVIIIVIANFDSKITIKKLKEEISQAKKEKLETIREYGGIFARVDKDGQIFLINPSTGKDTVPLKEFEMKLILDSMSGNIEISSVDTNASREMKKRIFNHIETTKEETTQKIKEDLEK